MIPPAGTPGPPTEFSQQVCRRFGLHAAAYDQQARLQLALAWRLGHGFRQLPLVDGPMADLGAGSGLLSLALLRQRPALERCPPMQLDFCAELLALNPLGATSLRWDLNRGLPVSLQGAALLASSFALQWLDDPVGQLTHWCQCLRPGGWLLLAVPTAGSFPQWQRAAAAAAVPCTALALPVANQLIATSEGQGLELGPCRRLRFSLPRQGGLTTLRHLRRLGAGSSRQPPLSPGQLRRLLAHWPATTSLTWEVLQLVGRKR